MRKKSPDYWIVIIPFTILWPVLIFIDWKKKDKLIVTIANLLLYIILFTVINLFKN